MIVALICAGAFTLLWLIVHCAGENKRIDRLTDDVRGRDR